MEVFSLFEATIANAHPDNTSIKDLRRDQLLDIYEKRIKTLQTLIKAKENEIAYRRDLIDMLEQSKEIYDTKLAQTKQEYQAAKEKLPSSDDSKESGFKNDSMTASSSNTPSPSMSTSPMLFGPTSQISPLKNSDLDLPTPSDNSDNRRSLDRRLSEFLKTFPNLTQAGLTTPSGNNDVKPMPGYYTQQMPPAQQPISAPAPPLMAMMRYPPPNMLASSPTISNPSMLLNQENHDAADMELSDHDEPSGSFGQPMIPMVASAMQKGAGGKQGPANNDSSMSYAQQFINPVPYTPRLNPLPFDPSIMDTRLRDSSSSSGGGARDRQYGDRGAGLRNSANSGSSGGGIKHTGSNKGKYSSSSSSSSLSHSSSRNKHR